MQKYGEEHFFFCLKTWFIQTQRWLRDTLKCGCKTCFVSPVLAVCSNSQAGDELCRRFFSHLSSLADTLALPWILYFPLSCNFSTTPTRWIINLSLLCHCLEQSQISQTENIFQLEKSFLCKICPTHPLCKIWDEVLIWMSRCSERMQSTMVCAIAMRWVDCVLDYYADLFWYIFDTFLIHCWYVYCWYIVDCVLDYYADLFRYISIPRSLWDTLIWRSGLPTTATHVLCEFGCKTK